MQHKTKVTVNGPEQNLGAKIFRRLDWVMGHKNEKRSTKQIRATESSAALVAHGPRTQKSRPKTQHGRQQISSP